MNDYSNDDDANFPNDLKAFIIDVKESMGIIASEADPDDANDTDDPQVPKAAASDAVQPVVQAGGGAAVGGGGGGGPGPEESRVGADGQKELSMTRQQLMSSWFDDVRACQQGTARSPMTVSELKLNIEEHFLSLAAKDANIVFKKSSDKATLLAFTDKKKKDNLQLCMGGCVSLQQPAGGLGYKIAALGPSMALWLDGSKLDPCFPWLAWTITKSSDPCEQTMDIVDQCHTISVKVGRAKFDVECCFKVLKLKDGIADEWPLLLCRPLLPDEDVKLKKPVSYSAKVVAQMDASIKKSDGVLGMLGAKRDAADTVDEVATKVVVQRRSLVLRMLQSLRMDLR